jgi:hypothetical protein
MCIQGLSRERGDSSNCSVVLWAIPAYREFVDESSWDKRLFSQKRVECYSDRGYVET